MGNVYNLAVGNIVELDIGKNPKDCRPIAFNDSLCSTTCQS